MSSKPIPHYQFLATFEKMKKKPVYAIIGNDTYFSEIIQKKILKSFQTSGSSDFDSILLHAGSDEVETALDHMETMPFLSEYMIVTIKDFDAFTAKEIEPLKKYLQNPSPTSVLIIMAQKLDARTVFYKSIVKQGAIVECKSPYQANDIVRWLRAELTSRKVKMEAEGQQFFSNSVELDYRIAAMELEKVLLFTNNASFIRSADVKKCIGFSKKNKIFDLQKELGKANLKPTIQILENLLANEDLNKIGVFTVIMLTRFFTTIYKVHACRKKNLSDQEIISHHLPEVFYLFRKDYLHYAQNYDETALRKVFSLLLQCDVDLKSLNVSSAILLEMLMYKIIQATGKKYGIS